MELNSMLYDREGIPIELEYVWTGRLCNLVSKWVFNNM